jgi:hypothetical protein
VIAAKNILRKVIMAESKVSSLEGNEIADDFVRTSVPKSRWSDTWDLIKSCFVKLVIINVLTLLFFVPAIAVLYVRSAYISQLGTIYPFSANVGIYPFSPSTTGLEQQIVFSADLMFYSLLIVAGLIASVGLAGGAYSIRKLINTHGEFTVKGYFHGIRVCYFNTVLPVTVVMLFFFASVVVSDWAALRIAQGYSAGGPITAKVFMIIATVIVSLISLWVFTVGVSYRVKFKYLMKNSFVLLLGSLLQTILMLVIVLVPVWLLLLGLVSTFIRIIAYALFIFMGFSFMMICWFAFAQWVFDVFVTPAVQTEKQAARAKMTPEQIKAETEEQEKQAARDLLAAGKSELIGRPIKPIEAETAVGEIGIVFTRDDIKKASDDRAKLDADLEAYVDKHKNDTKFVEYNKMFADREKALKSPDKKSKKKKISSDNLLR